MPPHRNVVVRLQLAPTTRTPASRIRTESPTTSPPPIRVTPRRPPPTHRGPSGPRRQPLSQSLLPRARLRPAVRTGPEPDLFRRNRRRPSAPSPLRARSQNAAARSRRGLPPGNPCARCGDTPRTDRTAQAPKTLTWPPTPPPPASAARTLPRPAPLCLRVEGRPGKKGKIHSAKRP